MTGDATGEDCRRCGHSNPPWSAPSPLWNQVMRGGDINGVEIYDGIVCPNCFIELAEQAGIADLWRLSAERVKVPLQMTTPDGRIWNADTWLWQEPPCERCGGTGMVPTLRLGGKNHGAISEMACPRCTGHIPETGDDQ